VKAPRGEEPFLALTHNRWYINQRLSLFWGSYTSNKALCYGQVMAALTVLYACLALFQGTDKDLTFATRLVKLFV
jgi:hypothetical protein